MTAWLPPKRSYQLRIFLLSLAIIAVSLAFFLFGVRMEATAPTTGIIEPREVLELRAQVAGLVEPGWYEGKVGSAAGPPWYAARLDREGNGVAAGDDRSFAIKNHAVPAGMRLWNLNFHALRPGDVLWSNQTAALLRNDELRFQLERLEDQIAERASQGQAATGLEKERDRLRQQLALTTIRAARPQPLNGGYVSASDHWLVTEVHVSPGQAVRAGDRIASLVAVDPSTHRPRDLVVRLDIDERYWSEIAVGESVRLRSTVHNHRLHGTAVAVIERLEPLGEPGHKGERRFHAVAAITEAPFPLPLGSSCRGEILVGKKLVYRIILEH